MRTLRGNFLKWLAWLFWKLHITTEKDYVNYLINLKAVETGLRIKVPLKMRALDEKGFQKSSGDIIAYMDVDIGCTLKPQQMAYYLRKLNSSDVVVASKRHPQSKINYLLHRRILSRALSGMSQSVESPSYPPVESL